MQQQKTSIFHILIRALAFLVLITAGTVAFAAFSYRVEIDAPPVLRQLLSDYLRIVTLQNSAQMNLEQLRREYRQAPEEIRGLAATEGYFSPEIVPSLTETSGGWVAHFVVRLSEPVRIADVDISFAGAILDTSPENDALRRRLVNEWQLKQGERFRQADWETAKRALLQGLVIQRYPAARLSDSEARVEPALSTAELRLQVDSGPVFTFGKLSISGLERYSPSVVERLNPIHEGEQYSLKKLLDFQQRLQDTGYFASAVVAIDPDPAAPKEVPVNVVVTEARSKKIAFGIGYSTDVGDRLSIEYQNVNLLARGLRLKSALRLETRRQSLTGEILFPRTASGYDDRISSTVERQNVQGETLRRYGVTGTRGRTRGNIEAALSLTYQFENQTVQGAQGDIRQAVALNYSWTQRALDNLLFPRAGYLINLQLGGAPKLLPQSASFIRGYGRGNYFFPVGKLDVLILRAEAGLVAAKSRENIPSDFLFRTGGDQSVRGYAFQSIGVKEGDAIVGGRVLGVASIEYAHYFTEQWGAAVFYDVGNATDDRKDFSLQQGYGVGARWRSPVGPLNLDLGYGQAKGDFRIHFSVGLVF